MIAALGLLLVSSMLVAARSRRVPGFVIGLSGALGAMAMLALLWQAQLAAAATGGPAALVWTSEAVHRGALIFLAGGGSLLIGAVMAGGPAPALRREEFEWYRIHLSRVMPTALTFSALSVAAWIAGRGPDALLIRETSISDAAHPHLVALFGPFLAVAFGIAALAWFNGNRLSGGLLMGAITVCAFANGSRLLGLLPLLWLLVRQLFRQAGPLVILYAVALSGLGLELALNLRQAPLGHHGLVPYASDLISSTPYMGSWIQSVAGILFAVPLAGAVATTHTFDTHALAVSVDPLIGNSSEWNLLAPTLRVHPIIPFNAFGELASFSPFALCGFFILFGALVCRVLVLAHRRGPLWTVTVSAAVALNTVLLLEYNLRSGMRVVFLLVALLAVLLLARRREQAPLGGHGADTPYMSESTDAAGRHPAA